VSYHFPCERYENRRPRPAVRRRPDADHNGNVARSDGLDRCACGCKYWRNDRCVDCGDTTPHNDRSN